MSISDNLKKAIDAGDFYEMATLQQTEGGVSGTSGYSGSAAGDSGYSGISGYSGKSGYSGFSSWSGYSGVSGIFCGDTEPPSPVLNDLWVDTDA